LLFSQDRDIATPAVLLKLIEQATFTKPSLDPAKLTVPIIQDYLRDLIELLTEVKEPLPDDQAILFC